MWRCSTPIRAAIRFSPRTVPALLADKGLAFVQAAGAMPSRRQLADAGAGPVARSHFAVEQEARFRAGLAHQL